MFVLTVASRICNLKQNVSASLNQIDLAYSMEMLSIPHVNDRTIDFALKNRTTRACFIQIRWCTH